MPLVRAQCTEPGCSFNAEIQVASGQKATVTQDIGGGHTIAITDRVHPPLDDRTLQGRTIPGNLQTLQDGEVIP